MKAAVWEPINPKIHFVSKELSTPNVEDDEVLIKVAANTVSKGDCVLTRNNRYEFSLLGDECSGHVIAVGQNVTRWKIGDKVCALLDGGGYFEKVAVKAEHVLDVPNHISIVQAAGLPVAACVVYLAIFQIGYLSQNDTILIHDSNNIIEMLALHVAKYFGARVLVATETKKRKDLFKRLGADLCINYVKEDLSAKVLQWTKSQGVDIILDIDASNLQQYYEVLRRGGVLAIVYMSVVAVKKQVPIPHLMATNSRVKVIDRVAVLEDKTLVKKVEESIWPVIKMGIKLFKHKILPISLAKINVAYDTINAKIKIDVAYNGYKTTFKKKKLLLFYEYDDKIKKILLFYEYDEKKSVRGLKKILKNYKSKKLGQQRLSNSQSQFGQ